jgi:hypothetical protein
MVKFEFSSYLIKIRTTYSNKDKCAAIPGGRWNPKSKTWDYLLTPSTAASIIQSFPKEIIPQDREFLTLMARRLVVASAIKNECKELHKPITQTEPWHHQLISYNMVVELFGLKNEMRG